MPGRYISAFEIESPREKNQGGYLPEMEKID